MIRDWPMGVLTECALDLLRGLEGKDFPLIFCGGFGLYLKQMKLQEHGLNYQPLLAGDLWPRPRTTEDMDILIRTEILADPGRFIHLRHVLDTLGYQPIRGVEYMQFARQLVDGGSVKVDLLTGPVPELFASKVTIKDRRIRPVGQSLGLHARRTDEAIGFQSNLQSIRVAGTCTDGQPYESTVFTPPPVTFLMMKLFAFRDRNQDEEKDFARHHAMDLYRVVAMMSHEDFQQTRAAIGDHWNDEVIQQAKQVVADQLTSATSLGLIRLREHDLFEGDMDVGEFSRALVDLFAGP